MKTYSAFGSGAAACTNPLYLEGTHDYRKAQAAPHWLRYSQGLSDQGLGYLTNPFLRITSASGNKNGFGLGVPFPQGSGESGSGGLSIPSTPQPAGDCNLAPIGTRRPTPSSRVDQSSPAGDSTLDDMDEIVVKFKALGLLGPSQSRPAPLKSCLKKPTPTTPPTLHTPETGSGRAPSTRTKATAQDSSNV